MCSNFALDLTVARPLSSSAVRQPSVLPGLEVMPFMPKESEKAARPKVTIIPGRGVSQTINYLLEDRDDLEWLVAVGRNKNGEIFFYDTGGDIVEDLGTLEYLKERITRAHFGDEPE